MKRCVVYAEIFIILISVVSLSACGTGTMGTPNSEGTKPTVVATATPTPTVIAKATATVATPVTLTATRTPQENTPVSDPSPTTTLTIPVQASVSARTGEIAPPYEEIKATLLALRGDPKSPITQEESRQLAAFQESLAGKRIEGWVGWIISITPYKEFADANEHDFTASFVMNDPSNEKERQYRKVILHGLSREQAEQFEAWNMNLDTTKAKRVVFSGTIFYVHDLIVEAYVTQIMPAK